MHLMSRDSVGIVSEQIGINMLSTIEWNEVGERLPKAGIYTLTNVGLSFWNGRHWWLVYPHTDKGAVTHWAKIPAVLPPQLSAECSQCATLLGHIKLLREQLETAERIK